jgi:hypothetical protein
MFVALGARFTQFLGAFFAADFNNMRSDFDLDGCCIEFVVTDGAGFLGHLSISLSARLSGLLRRPFGCDSRYRDL